MTAREVLSDLRLPDQAYERDWFFVGDFGADAIIKALASAGYAIVPVEPSERMVEAGFKAIFEPESCLSDIEIEDVYCAMLTAAKEGE